MRKMWRGQIVKDMEWLLKNWGVFLLLLLIAVIAGDFTRVKENEVKKEQSMAVWEPSVEIVNSDIAETSTEEIEMESEPESETEQDLWFLPQEEHCLITDTEKEELNNRALTAAEQVREVYKDIEITDESPYGSSINEFTKEQRRKVVSLLGSAGYVSVTEDTNMENYEEIEEFYAVWPDYNSDRVFTNTIVVQPFEDGTFRYLSNFVEQKELEVPEVME